MRRLLTRKWFKGPVFAFALVPVLLLLRRYFEQDLGANPVETITHATGDWTLRFLAMTLAISPLRRLLGLPELIRFRRMFGLFAFFYGCLHLATYLWLDKFFDFGEIAKDVYKRPFITVGFVAFVGMIPLAVTSTAGWIRRLGGKRWAQLHRLIYLSAIAGVAHYYWLVKSDVRLPLLYGAIMVVLLGERLWRSFGSNAATPRSPRAPSSPPTPAA